MVKDRSAPHEIMLDCLKINNSSTYLRICPCNQDNGGSGVCNCILKNKEIENVDPINPVQQYYHHEITCINGIITKSEFKKVSYEGKV